MTDKWADLPWHDDVTSVKATESMWRDFASRGTYVADTARNGGDTRIASRTRSWTEGTVEGVRRDLGEVSAGADGIFVTYVKTPVEYSQWVELVSRNEGSAVSCENLETYIGRSAWAHRSDCVNDSCECPVCSFRVKPEVTDG